MLFFIGEHNAYTSGRGGDEYHAPAHKMDALHRLAAALWVDATPALASCVGTVYEGAVVAPLRRLYLGGPRSIGFWGGMALTDICARMSGVPAEFWRARGEQGEQCDALVRREVAAFVVGVEAVVCTFGAITICRVAWHRAVVEPTMHRTATRFAKSLRQAEPVSPISIIHA